MTCTHCGRALSNVQWAATNRWKSCPRCSARNGSEHVFYPYPDLFGTTPARATHEHPEGPQSYCTACRGTGTPDLTRSRPCSDVNS